MATLILYRSSKIEPEHNFKIDSIASYLASKDKITINDFQYTKVSESIEFDKVINGSQTYLEPKAINDYDYASITESGRIYYYFITEKRWASTAACKFHFVLDTINTFAIQTDYVITKRSKVNREHKDRFYKEKPLKYSFNWESISGAVPTTNSLLTINYNDTLLSGLVTSKSGDDFYITFLPISSTSVINALLEAISQSAPLTVSIIVNGISGIISLKSYTDERRLVRKISLYSEGVFPVLYKKELGVLLQPINTSWNLYYKTATELSVEQNNSVTCKLIPDEKLNFETYVGGGTIVPSALVTGKYYWVMVGSSYPNKTNIQLSSPQAMTAQATEEWWQNTFNFFVIHKVSASSIEVKEYTYVEQFVGPNAPFYSLTLNGTYTGTQVDFVNPSNNITYYYMNALPSTALLSDTSTYATGQFNFGGVTSVIINPLSSYDRTLSTLIKIIKLPYSPSAYSYDEISNTMSISSEWSYNDNSFELNNLDFKFKYTITTTLDNPIEESLFHTKAINVGEDRIEDNESQIYHSDFFQIKFVYDSFSYVFPLEQLDVESSTFGSKFNFTFVVTSTMNSKFAFMFEEYKYKYAREDYENVLPVARNNEVVIYNSTYLNYLRTAYNYDLKAKERAITSSSIGLGTTIVGSVAGVAISAATMNPALIVSSVIGATAALTSAVVNNVNTIASQEQSMESKLAQLRAQSVSVSGSDDVDIMEAYTGNRAKLVQYETSPVMKKALSDLYYYTGCPTNEMKIPEFNTRVWFNYISMEIDVLDTHSICETFMNDLKARWANGVTILHKYNNTWDINQEKENWEVSLL